MMVMAMMIDTIRRNMKPRIGETLEHKNKKVKVIGYLNLENELTQNYKPHYKIVVQDKEGIKWVKRK
jgi:hypothetical protein